MAFEASHLNIYPPQILSNRGTMMDGLESMKNIYDAGMTYGGLSTVSPMYGTVATTVEMMFPMNELATTHNVMMRDDSSLTYAQLPVLSRKRSRGDSNNSINMTQLVPYPNIYDGDNRSSSGQFTFFGEDLSFEIQRHQLEVDSLIARHIEKVRFEIEEMRKRYLERIMAAVEEKITKILKAKDDEIQKSMKLNWALEERIKSLCAENQIWSDLAQSHDATTQILRHNLEQMLAQNQDVYQNHEREVLVDDAQSCCGSNDKQKVETRKDFVENNHNKGCIDICRNCGNEEACVLLLPCRHLSLCSVCASSEHICPICKTKKNGSLHINMSS